MKIKKRIFNWDGVKDKRYENRECPDFDFIEECKPNGAVVWWNERQYCVDMDKLKGDEK